MKGVTPHRAPTDHRCPTARREHHASRDAHSTNHPPGATPSRGALRYLKGSAAPHEPDRLDAKNGDDRERQELPVALALRQVAEHALELATSLSVVTSAR
jgi:hypothetical protein